MVFAKGKSGGNLCYTKSRVGLSSLLPSPRKAKPTKVGVLYNLSETVGSTRDATIGHLRIFLPPAPVSENCPPIRMLQLATERKAGKLKNSSHFSYIIQ